MISSPSVLALFSTALSCRQVHLFQKCLCTSCNSRDLCTFNNWILISFWKEDGWSESTQVLQRTLCLVFISLLSEKLKPFQVRLRQQLNFKQIGTHRPRNPEPLQGLHCPYTFASPDTSVSSCHLLGCSHQYDHDLDASSLLTSSPTWDQTQLW